LLQIEGKGFGYRTLYHMARTTAFVQISDTHWSFELANQPVAPVQHKLLMCLFKIEMFIILILSNNPVYAIGDLHGGFGGA